MGYRGENGGTRLGLRRHHVKHGQATCALLNNSVVG